MFGAIFHGEVRVSFVGAQPSLDGRTCLVGDIRLDGRAEFGPLASSDGPSDELLCLQAYAKWGKDGFLDHLAGDFCFALWDQTSGQLICARDQLGVHPLFYGQAKGTWFVGNSLTWIASQAGISCELDDYWVADFLGIGHCLEFGRTAYRHIHRLPPANVLTISSAGASVRRYWQLDIPEPVHYRDRGRYAEQFTELLSRSIGDRLPAAGRVGISLSGGLDSGTLAACTVGVAADAARVIAETKYFDRLIPDDEKHFSSLVARRLGIGLRLRAMDDLIYDPHWRTRPIRTAEPTWSIVRAHSELMIAGEMAAEASVWLYGEGPDNALQFEWRAYLSWLFGRRAWDHLGPATAQYLRGRTMGDWVRFAKRCVGLGYVLEAAHKLPPWLDADLVRSLHLAERLRDMGKTDRPDHPWHPRAMASFSSPIWQSFLESFDLTGSATPPFDWRHPYLDLRVLGFLLSVPPIPWARRKVLLREAMRGQLPAEILARTKTPLAQSPLRQAIRIHGLPSLSGSALFSRYVNEKQLSTSLPGEDEVDKVVRVHALDHWLTDGRA